MARKAVAVAKPQVKKPVLTKPKPVEVIEEVKQERQEKVVSQNEKSGASKKNKKKAPTMTALLTARSKVNLDCFMVIKITYFNVGDV